MTVHLCIRQGSEINDDSVSVEELDWSAESQVLIPAEHLWCDFKCRHWAVLTTRSLEEKKALPNCGNKDGNITNVHKIVFTSLLQQFWSVWNDYSHMSLAFGDEFLAQGLHLKSHQKCSAGIGIWLSTDQSNSSTLTDSSFLFDPWLISFGILKVLSQNKKRRKKIDNILFFL